MFLFILLLLIHIFIKVTYFPIFCDNNTALDMMTSPVTNLTKVQTSTEQVLYIYIIQIPQTEEFYGFGFMELIVNLFNGLILQLSKFFCFFFMKNIEIFNFLSPVKNTQFSWRAE